MKLTNYRRLLAFLIIVIISFDVYTSSHIRKTKKKARSRKYKKNLSKTYAEPQQRNAYEFHPTASPSVILEVFRIIKKMWPTWGDVHDQCLAQMTSSKYNEQMKGLWDTIGRTLMRPLSGPVRKQWFTDFILQTSEEVIVEGKIKNCPSVVSSNIISQSEMENEAKQRELKSILNAYFQPPISGPTGKTYLSAFIGPHRDTAGLNIFAALNGRQ